MIIAAAIRIGDVVAWVPRPGRHHNIVNTLGRLRPEAEHQMIQGFIDHRYHFMDRMAAGEHAINTGQIPELHWPPNLYTEDLW